MKILGRKLQGTLCFGTRTDVLLDLLQALFVQFFQNFLSREKNHNVKKHTSACARVGQKGKVGDGEFHSFCFLRKHGRKSNGSQRGPEAQIVHVTQLMGNFDSKSLKKLLQTGKHFLAEKEMENGRQGVFGFCFWHFLSETSLGKDKSCVWDSQLCG